MSSVEHLRLAGGCTVAEAPARHQALAAALAATPAALAIDLSAVERADVTLVQLLLAARASARRHNHSVSVSAWSPAATAAFAGAGVPAGLFDSTPSLGS